MSTERGTIDERFAEFHVANPLVYEELEKLTLAAFAAGQRKIGIAMVYETMRYNLKLRTLKDADGFKLNNDFRALYARKMIAAHPQLDGVIEIRVRRAA